MVRFCRLRRAVQSLLEALAKSCKSRPVSQVGYVRPDGKADSASVAAFCNDSLAALRATGQVWAVKVSSQDEEKGKIQKSEKEAKTDDHRRGFFPAGFSGKVSVSVLQA